LVLLRICSRPWRTSCENVGTSLPFATTRSAESDFGAQRDGTHQDARRTKFPKLNCNCCPENCDGTPHTTPVESFAPTGQSGEGCSALRGWRPIHAAPPTPIRPTMFRGGRPSPIQPLARSQLQGL
jgi:hypothetical protein